MSITIVAADELRLLTGVKRAESVKVARTHEAMVVDIDDGAAAKEPLSGAAPEPARPSTAPPQSTAVSSAPRSYKFAPDFFDNVVSIYDSTVHPFVPGSVWTCIRCEERIYRPSGFGSNAIVVGCGHWHANTCSDCIMSLVQRAGTAALTCEVSHCSGYLLVNRWPIDMLLASWASEDAITGPHAKYNTSSFKTDWTAYKGRIGAYEVDVFYCCVCGERKTRDHDLLEKPPGSSCDHESNTCKSCLSHSIVAQMEDRMWDGLTCPECVQPIDYELVKAAVSSEVFVKYDTYLTTRALQNDSRFRWCPYRDCEGGQIVDLDLSVSGCKDDNRTIVCNSCNRKSCFAHREIHEGRSCRQHDRARILKRWLRRSDRAVWRTTKGCPGSGCQAKIEKNEGCSHMTCTMCRHEFCWVCKVPYEQVYIQGNKAHRWFCRHQLIRW